MAEGSTAEGQDRGPHLRVGDDLDTEDVGEARAAVGAEGAEDEVLSLLIEDEDAGDHDGRVVCFSAPIGVWMSWRFFLMGGDGLSVVCRPEVWWGCQF